MLILLSAFQARFEEHATIRVHSVAPLIFLFLLAEFLGEIFCMFLLSTILNFADGCKMTVCLQFPFSLRRQLGTHPFRWLW